MVTHPAIDSATGQIIHQHLNDWKTMRTFIWQRMQQMNPNPTVDISANQQTEMKRWRERWKTDREGFEQEVRQWLQDNFNI